MKFPNFLVIGRAKSGTTALWQTLRSHPEIYMPLAKEPSYFVTDGAPTRLIGPPYKYAVHRLDEYMQLFSAVTTETALGEASIQYLECGMAEQAAHRIRAQIPGARLIAIIRQPADFIHSYYYFLRSRGMEKARSLQAALDEEQAGARSHCYPGFRYWENSLNVPQLKAYYDRFPREQIKVFIYEEWRDAPQPVLAEICAFLEVEPFPAQYYEVAQANTTHARRISILGKLIGKSHPILDIIRRGVPAAWRKSLALRLQAWNRTRPDALDPALRASITQARRTDILQTQELIQKDLSHWLT